MNKLHHKLEHSIIYLPKEKTHESSDLCCCEKIQLRSLREWQRITTSSPCRISCTCLVSFAFLNPPRLMDLVVHRRILEEHRAECEAQGKYVEAEIAKKRLDELHEQ